MVECSQVCTIHTDSHHRGRLLEQGISESEMLLSLNSRLQSREREVLSFQHFIFFLLLRMVHKPHVVHAWLVHHVITVGRF